MYPRKFSSINRGFGGEAAEAAAHCPLISARRGSLSLRQRINEAEGMPPPTRCGRYRNHPGHHAWVQSPLQGGGPRPPARRSRSARRLVEWALSAAATGQGDGRREHHPRRILDAVIELLLRSRYVVGAAVLALLAYLAVFGEHVGYEQSIASFFADDDPDLKAYQQAAATFGDDNFVFLVYDDPDVVSAAGGTTSCSPPRRRPAGPPW